MDILPMDILPMDILPMDISIAKMSVGEMSGYPDPILDSVTITMSTRTPLTPLVNLESRGCYQELAYKARIYFG